MQSAECKIHDRQHMAKVIIFSRFFPSYHPRKEESTHFVEKFYNSFSNYWDNIPIPDKLLASLNIEISQSKFHTIRAGNRWKAGDKFSPRVWSGKPYQSKQIIIAADTEVKKIFRFEVKKGSYFLNGKKINMRQLYRIAINDGFNNSDDLKLWFQKPFKGQIICWNENVKY